MGILNHVFLQLPQDIMPDSPNMGYYGNHPEALFALAILLATFALVMAGVTMSVLP